MVQNERGGLAGLILSGEDFFFFFSFRFLSLGAEWWELIEGFGLRTSLYLTDICKSPISRGCSHGEDAARGPETPAGCSIVADACSRLGRNVGLYIHGCVGHAWGMWTIDMAPRQGRDYYRSPPLFKSLARKKRGAGFDVAAVSFFFSLKLAFVLKQQDWQGYFLYFFSFFSGKGACFFNRRCRGEEAKEKGNNLCEWGRKKKNNPSNNL